MTMHPTLHSVLVASPPRRLFLPSYVSVIAISLLTDKFSLLVDRNTSASQLCPQFPCHLSFGYLMWQPGTVYRRAAVAIQCP